LGSEPSLTHLGKLFNIPSFIFSEDDAAIIPQFAKIAYPFVDVIVSPKSCDAGRWSHKKIAYDGFHKLAYLYPSVFEPNVKEIGELIKTNYFILRFANLIAYHDEYKTGITDEIAMKLIQILERHGTVYITSERPLSDEFTKYELKINPVKIHHYLSFAKMYIGDSQSMAVESALLGTPGIRFNDFAGEIGVLNELEYKYGLTHSYKTNQEYEFLQKVQEMLEDGNLENRYKSNYKRMLDDKINVPNFFVWLIENYPESASLMKENPNYQYSFQ
jgi:hypothetical protein